MKKNQAPAIVGLENLNRATIHGYLKFMLANPVYFKDLSGMEATKSNITWFFSRLRLGNLVCARETGSELKHAYRYNTKSRLAYEETKKSQVVSCPIAPAIAGSNGNAGLHAAGDIRPCVS